VRTSSETKRARLNQYLADNRPARITEAEWRELRETLAPVSESYLRGLLRSCGLPLDPGIEGVRQDSFEELERTLVALAEEYGRAVGTGDRERAARCRQAVLTGKEHARLAARRKAAPAETKARKEEMASWMLLWLENPSIFPAWVALRGKAAPSLEQGD